VNLETAALLKMAGAVAQKQLKQAGSLSFEALLVSLDILSAQEQISEARAMLAGPCQNAVHIPHELLRLKVRP
jgi:hypothetical protein